MSSAQLDIHPGDELRQHAAPAPPPFQLSEADFSKPHLKQQVAERIAAHRARRGQAAAAPAAQLPSDASRSSRSRSAHIAEAVAERYANSQSYRDFLAAESRRAVDQADAAAQIATINAQAIAAAQQQLLADLDNWDAPSPLPNGPIAVPVVPLSPVDYAALFDREPITPRSESHHLQPHWTDFDPSPSTPLPPPPSFTVRPFADVAHPAAQSATAHSHPRSSVDPYGREVDEDESLALDDEIAFRHDPIFDEIADQQIVAANLIEFPRQLVAARKARPRAAEGPLRGDISDPSQLRIFEVEADQLSTFPALSALSAEDLSPEWSSILLSALPSSDFGPADNADFLADIVPQPAPVSLRVMAAFVDACLILTVQVAFTAVFALALTHLSGEHAVLEIPKANAAIGAVATLAVLSVLYQLLFFTLSDATPGMRYARIALCTMADENPTRSAMRRRIFATLLAAFPLGLGLIWALLDEDSLGWHDRISRMYQRAY